MKRILAFLLAGALAFSLAACGEDTRDADKGADSTKETDPIIDTDSEIKPDSTDRVPVEETPGYEVAFENYEAALNGDESKLYEIAHEKYIQICYGDEVETAREDYEKRVISELKNTYGSDYTVSITMTQAEKCADELVQKIDKALRDDYGTAFDGISELYAVDYVVKTTGSLKADEQEVSSHVIHIGDNWYLFNYSFDDNDRIGIAFANL